MEKCKYIRSYQKKEIERIPWFGDFNDDNISNLHFNLKAELGSEICFSDAILHKDYLVRLFLFNRPPLIYQ